MKKFILVRRDTMKIVSPEEFDSFDEARIERHKIEIANPGVIVDIMITNKCEHPSNKDSVKHTIGNGWKLEFQCDRCKNKFWVEGGIAQVDCPVCHPRHLSNHPIITGRSEKI